MFEGICVVARKKGEPDPLLYIFKHNIADQKITNLHIEALDSQGLKPIVFTHAFEHVGPPDGCPYCAAAIDEGYRIAIEKKAAHGPEIRPGEASQGSVPPTQPMEEPAPTNSPPSSTSLSDHFRTLPRGSATSTHVG